MKNWPIKKLGEILELCDSGTWGKENPIGMPLLRSSNMQNGELVLEDLKHISVPENLRGKFTLREGDILVTKSSGSEAHIGKCLYITREMDNKYGFSNFTQRLRVNKKLVDPVWIYLILASPFNREKLIGASRTTSGLRNLKIPALKDFEIPVPGIEEQKRIVKKLEKILAKIEAARDLRSRSLLESNALLRTTLNNLFNVNEDKKNKKIIEVAKRVGGGTPSRNKKEYFKGKIPWFTVTDLPENDGRLITLTTPRQFITEDAIKYSATKLIPRGSVLLATRVGVGKVYQS